MLVRSIGAIAAALLLAASSAAQPDYDAFVIAGQSNALGSSTQNEDLLDGRVTSTDLDPLAAWSFRQADHRWVLANEFPCDDSQCMGTRCSYPGPTRTAAIHPQWTDQGYGTCVCHCGVHVPADNAEADAGRGSAWPTLARIWREQRGRSIRFVSTAIGGQCLVGAPTPAQPSWDPDAMDCATLAPIPLNAPIPPITAPGELYCRMLESVRVSGVRNLRGVLWLQGECEAGDDGVSFEAYENALLRLGDAIWRDLGVPLIVAPISRRTRSDACPERPRLDGIHAATLAAIAAHPRILLGPISDDLALEADCTHIHDVVSLGARWYDAIDAPVAACENQIDDDGDGLVDHPEDPGCETPLSTFEDPVCQNGFDDDADGRIDFDGGAAANGGVPLAIRDPQCAQPWGAKEKAPQGCGAGAELVLAFALLARMRAR